MIKIAVIGLGHLGKIHIKCIKQSMHLVLSAVWDIDKIVEKKIANEEDLPIFSTIDELFHAVDAVCIVSPTSTHFDWAILCLEAQKHIFIEKPVTATSAQALTLKGIAETKKLKIQVGHVERFNPAFLAVKDLFNKPMFIEGHRLSEFKPRGTDVSVVMDLMIHDIDLVLTMVKRPILEIRASGVAVMSLTPDICNARLEFEGGAVANLTASRISLKQMRKLRVFQQDEYIGLDLLDKESQIVKISDLAPVDHPLSWPIDTGFGIKHIQVDMPTAPTNNAILDELNAFSNSIKYDQEVVVTLDDGLAALKVAEEILSQIDSLKSKNVV